MPIPIHGAGVAGLIAATLLQRRGHAVVVHGSTDGCSPHAGGMLAPGSEADTAEPGLLELVDDPVAGWIDLVGPDAVLARGTLHVAHRPEWPLLDQLHARIRRAGRRVERVDASAIGALEPLLAGRFNRGLFLPDEGAVDPRVVLPMLRANLTLAPAIDGPGSGIDARGLRGDAPVRGVRGEYLQVRASVQLSRPVRLAHPRYPLYVVPRADGCTYVGATQLERDDDGPMEVRSALELLSALYTLHPGFGDGAIIAQGVGLRPAYADNLPRVERIGRRVILNGLFRHGYLLGPPLAARAVATYLEHVHDRTHQR